MNLTAAQRSSIDRRLRKYVRIAGQNECWLWIGKATADFGYGHMSAGRSCHLKAHRAAYEVWGGGVPEGMCVLHKCDVPACCNPAHLFLGTMRDNTRDMLAKGRGSRPPFHVGDSHPRATLNARKVRVIRQMLPDFRTGDIAHVVGCSVKNVYDIKHRKVWNHVA